MAWTEPESILAEALRWELLKQINSNPGDRFMLETRYGVGNVWDTSELRDRFDVLGFSAPFAVVRRVSDGKIGSVMFQHHPRWYFGFEGYDGDADLSTLRAGGQ